MSKSKSHLELSHHKSKTGTTHGTRNGTGGGGENMKSETMIVPLGPPNDGSHVTQVGQHQATHGASRLGLPSNTAQATTTTTTTQATAGQNVASLGNPVSATASVPSGTASGASGVSGASVTNSNANSRVHSHSHSHEGHGSDHGGLSGGLYKIHKIDKYETIDAIDPRIELNNEETQIANGQLLAVNSFKNNWMNEKQRGYCSMIFCLFVCIMCILDNISDYWYILYMFSNGLDDRISRICMIISVGPLLLYMLFGIKMFDAFKKYLLIVICELKDAAIHEWNHKARVLLTSIFLEFVSCQIFSQICFYTKFDSNGENSNSDSQSCFCCKKNSICQYLFKIISMIIVQLPLTIIVGIGFLSMVILFGSVGGIWWITHCIMYFSYVLVILSLKLMFLCIISFGITFGKAFGFPNILYFYQFFLVGDERVYFEFATLKNISKLRLKESSGSQNNDILLPNGVRSVSASDARLSPAGISPLHVRTMSVESDHDPSNDESKNNLSNYSKSQDTKERKEQEQEKDDKIGDVEMGVLSGINDNDNDNDIDLTRNYKFSESSLNEMTRVVNGEYTFNMLFLIQVIQCLIQCGVLGINFIRRPQMIEKFAFLFALIPNVVLIALCIMWIIYTIIITEKLRRNKNKNGNLFKTIMNRSWYSSQVA